MKAVVVDTNVLMVANAQGSDPQPWDLECVAACIVALERVGAEGLLAVDAAGEIVAEYLNNLGFSGMPGLGHAFAKWAHDHEWDEAVCVRVDVRKDAGVYLDIPETSGLRTFDPSDHKFIAVSMAHPERPEILEATDSKWWTRRTDFLAAGVPVTFLCPELIKRLHDKRSNRG